MSAAVQISNLCRSFGSSTVLAGINLELERGERLAAIGYSGSGKTTLLRLIAGLDVPSEGEIVLGGRRVSVAGRLLVPPERRRVAMVFQGLALFPHLRALDQIAFAARGRGGRARATQLLDRIGLGHRASAALDELSGGERQRIALARALAQEPELLLMDEPFASLDESKRAQMRGLLRSLLDETGTTLILVTHARDDALDLARRVLVLERGRPVAAGTLAGILADPRHSAAVRCLGLGQLIEGTSEGSRIASTAFGSVSIEREMPRGRVRLLVRAGQARLALDGVEVEVIATELRPPQADGVRRIAVVRRDGTVLDINVGDQPIEVGQRITVRIEGPCIAVDG